MKPNDIPTEDISRGLLSWRKTMNSNLTAYIMSAYNSLGEGDLQQPTRYYQEIHREADLRQDALGKGEGVKNLANIFRNLRAPAPKGKAIPADPYLKRKPKPGGAPEAEEAATVKPRLQDPIPRNIQRTRRGRSTSTDKRKVLRKLYAKGECTKGRDCPYTAIRKARSQMTSYQAEKR